MYMRQDELTMMIIAIELIILIPILLILAVAKWKIFVKAGRPGWESLIPVYGNYILTCTIAGKDSTTFILHFIPFINIYSTIVTSIALAKSFGKDDGFGIGLWILGIIFYPILAFSDAKYVGPDGVAAQPIPPVTNSNFTNFSSPE